MIRIIFDFKKIHKMKNLMKIFCWQELRLEQEETEEESTGFPDKSMDYYSAGRCQIFSFLMRYFEFIFETVHLSLSHTFFLLSFNINLCVSLSLSHFFTFSLTQTFLLLSLSFTLSLLFSFFVSLCQCFEYFSFFLSITFTVPL